MRERRVVVVGGGVIGTACAYYLAGDGWRVTVIDRARAGAACSFGNCGLIALSHVLPLNAPGAIRKTFQAMLRPDSPFSIKPRVDPRLWKWLLQFSLRCSAKHSGTSARVLAGLLESTASLYAQLFQDEKFECEWENRGCLFAFRDPKSFAEYEETDFQMRRDFGIGANRYTAGQVAEFEPALRGDLAGGWHYEMDSHLRPDLLTARWRDACEARGVEFREETAVTDLLGDPAVRAVRTAAGEEIAADAFVLACGALAPLWSKQLGCQIPVQPGKGYSLTIDRPQHSPQRPVIFHDHKVVITPLQSSLRLGSTMEFAGYDESIGDRRLQILRDAATLYLREPFRDENARRWFGWRAMSIDGVPIVGPIPARPNVFLATGHNMLGLTLAPVTGKLIAEMAGGHTTHLDSGPLSVTRFGR